MSSAEIYKKIIYLQNTIKIYKFYCKKKLVINLTRLIILSINKQAYNKNKNLIIIIWKMDRLISSLIKENIKNNLLKKMQGKIRQIKLKDSKNLKINH